MRAAGCPLCDGPGGVLIFSGPKFRVIQADEPGLPAFYRLVWTDHVAEFSDLTAAERIDCIEAVVQVEACIREHLHPVKVNLATLGNAVPHLHWHIIGRFDWDPYFPAAVWAPAQRQAPADAMAAIEALRPALAKDIAHRLSRGPGNQAGS